MEKYLNIIAIKFPNLKVNKCEFITNGADNDVLFINDKLIVRFSKTNKKLLQTEQKNLNHIRPFISIAIPNIQVYQQNNIEFSVHNIIKGITLREYNGNYFNFIKEIAKFLYELHSIKNFGLEIKETQNEWKYLKENYVLTKDFLEKKNINIEKDCDLIFTYKSIGEKVVCHYDLHNENIILEKQHLAGVIDFSDMCWTDFNAEFIFLKKDCSEKVFMEIVNEYQNLTGRKVDLELIKITERIWIYNRIAKKLKEEKNK